MKYCISIIIGVTILCAPVFAGPKDSSEKGKPAAFAETGAAVEAPATLRLKIVQNGFQLEWKLSPQDPGPVTGYEIVRSDRFSGPYDVVATIEKGTSRFVDTTAAREIIYFYKVRALTGKRGSPYSNTVSGER